MERSGENRIELPAGTTAEFPVRLNRFLALANVASRREADMLIESGRVSINGRKAVLGDKVEEGDEVALAQWKGAARKAYVAYLKPKGVATLSGDRSEGLMRLARTVKLAAVADLDKNSEGVVLLTNDGRVSRAIAARRPIESFVVKVQEGISETFTRKLESGIALGKNEIAARGAELIDEHKFAIDIDADADTVRAMCEALRRTAVSLRRTSFAGVAAKGLRTGDWRELDERETVRLLASLGIS